jgi:hypothetical protein
MDREIMTSERGTPEGNIAVALRQGRIAKNEEARWLQHFKRAGYERALADLLKRPVAHEVGPSRSYSESAWDEFATRCNLPGYRSGGYSRSVV